MLRKVDAVVLFVLDLDRAMTFYRDTLGVDVIFCDDHSCALRLEGQDFALLTRSNAAGMLNPEVVDMRQRAGQQVMLCATVDDVDADYAALTAKGVTFIHPPVDQPWGWRAAYFADPDGNIWEFRQSIPEQ
jgi:lactoylglutathione lyase